MGSSWLTYEYQVGVMNPIESCVTTGLESSILEKRDASLPSREVGVELVVHIFGGVNIGHWAFSGRRVHGNLDSIAFGIPVCALINIGQSLEISRAVSLDAPSLSPLEPVRQSMVAGLLPIVRGLGFLS